MRGALPAGDETTLFSTATIDQLARVVERPSAEAKR